jgi:hypothetical protein
MSVPWNNIFVPGEENWLTLLRDPHHLAFEGLTGIGQTLVINVLLLAVVWPFIRKHIHRDVKHGVEHSGRPLSSLAGQCVDADAYGAQDVEWTAQASVIISGQSREQVAAEGPIAVTKLVDTKLADVRESLLAQIFTPEERDARAARLMGATFAQAQEEAIPGAKRRGAGWGTEHSAPSGDSNHSY